MANDRDTAYILTAVGGGLAIAFALLEVLGRGRHMMDMMWWMPFETARWWGDFLVEGLIAIAVALVLLLSAMQMRAAVGEKLRTWSIVAIVVGAVIMASGSWVSGALGIAGGIFGLRAA